MTINFKGGGVFEIKCKEGTIVTGEKIKINNFELPGPGEYEVGGISAEHVDGIFIFSAEDMNFVYLSRKKILNNTELEKVEGTDILFLPVGKIIDIKNALELANQIGPKIVVPMYYDSIDELKKIEGITPEILDQLKISKNILPQEERKIIALDIKK